MRYSPLPSVDLDPRNEAALVQAATQRVYEASGQTLNDFSASKGGEISGKLPWWYNPKTRETTRAKKSPGESWQLGRSPDLMTDLIKNLKPELANSQLYKDLDHPELGSHSAGTLVQMQTRRGYPHGKENRIKAGVKP